MLKSLLNLIQSVNTTMVLLYSCNSEHLLFVFELSCAGYPLYNTEGIRDQDGYALFRLEIEPHREKTCFYICEQQRYRSACASAV